MLMGRYNAKQYFLLFLFHCNVCNIGKSRCDPTYMIRAIASNASDNIYCTLLAHGAVHGAMAGYTGFTVGPVNSKQAYIPIACVMEKQNKVKLTDRMWARLLASTNQPSFVAYDQERVEKDINNMNITSQTRFNRYFD
ncbi:hypothetical protein GLYMA_20G195733v4 [Glycine max]|nr:hypothetical protein GLYMA_20G195733v4 [Glycine max]KAH1036977.1 hypothetical protein GYH30_056404 [Glycine max]